MSIKTNTIRVNTVNDLFSLLPGHGDWVQTLGYSAIADGGTNEYVYDLDSTGTPDGGFILPGVGGSLSFNGYGTFNGTLSTGRFLAVNNQVADMQKFGSSLDGSGDDDAVLRNAMNSGASEVFFPAGVYAFNSFVNLKSNIKYRGAGIGKTILKRTGTQRHIFAISTYDFESFDAETFVENKENIEICDMTLDWNFYDGWEDYGALIQFKGSDTGNSDTIQDIYLHHLSFIDSQNVAHDGNDAWAINVSAFATSQQRLVIEHCKQLQEGHQFIAGGGGGWDDVVYRNNWVYHPHANGITATTVTESAQFRRVNIENNIIIGPYGLGIWVGPDQVSDGGTNLYEDIIVRNNQIVLDNYSQGGSTVGVRVNCSEGTTRRINIENNTVSFTEDFGGSAEHCVVVENTAGQEIQTASQFSQIEVDATGVISLISVGEDTPPSGITVVLTDGGVYELNSISGNDFYVTRLDNVPGVSSGTIIPSGTTVETFGVIEDVTIKGNKGVGCRITVNGTNRPSVQDNDVGTIELKGIGRDISVYSNSLERLSVEGYQTGIVSHNRFRQWDDSGSLGNIRINVNDYRGMPGTDSLLYISNNLTSQGEDQVQSRFVFEVAGSGIYDGHYYHNIVKSTNSRSFNLIDAESRHSAWNIYRDANVDTYPASLQDMRYYTESLDFDLTSNVTQSLVVTATGVTYGDIILISIPNASASNNVFYTARAGFNQIIVTATRTDASVSSNPGAGTFQFTAIKPR